MPDRNMPIAEILPLIAAAPGRIAALTERLTPEQLHAVPAPGEWSANDILAHLRACADVVGDCMSKLATEEEPTLQMVDPREWIKQTDYPTLDFRTSLRAYAAQRADLVLILEPLPHERWSRSALVKRKGSARERTLHSYGHRLSRHEGQHIREIARIAKAALPKGQ
jgi:hypothetical protein